MASVKISICFSVLLLLSSCKANSESELPTSKTIGEVTFDEFFDINKVHEIALTLNPSDFENLSNQNRNKEDLLSGDCTAKPFSNPFTYFPAQIAIENKVFRQQVGLRKNGFLGSLSKEKPSLKLDLERYINDRSQRFAGIKQLYLVNGKQDPSLIRSCLAYRLFSQVGLKSPSCNFVHLTVNEKDLGVYINVESIDEEFVKRHFDNETGDLFDGTISDFRPEFIGTFQKQTNIGSPSRAALIALESALTVEDSVLIPALDAVVDLEEFFTFWAMEILTNSADGYANNINNFFVYHVTATNKLVFIVLGPDNTFRAYNPIPAGPGAPISVFASGLLTRRLYLNPEGQARFFTRLHELLDSVFDAGKVNQEIDRMEQLLKPFKVVDLENLAQLRSFVSGRRKAILDELAAGPPVWSFPLKETPCLRKAEVIGGW